jgi:hypothetical protein
MCAAAVLRLLCTASNAWADVLLLHPAPVLFPCMPCCPPAAAVPRGQQEQQQVREALAGPVLVPVAMLKLHTATPMLCHCAVTLSPAAPV